ncbi:MAG: CoB--CoM heterodisulfide reductase iron-sulfur subunit A family protein [Bacteroidota bacterium]
MKERIGVYICHCGGNISDYVDVEELGKMFHAEDGVVISKDVMFACADSNQKAMVNDIKEYNLDAIVVASCSPKLHLHTFKNVATRAGLNPTNYVQVNIREQCSWPHSDKPREATVKAAGLIRAGINRVSHSESLDNIEITVKRAVLVVGAGVSGMKAAIDLARLGNEVYLVEKDYFVGGRIAQTEKLFMTGQAGKDVVTKLFAEVKSYKNITLFTGATIEKASGSLGNFHVDVKIQPRYINGKADKDRIKKAMEECEVTVNDEFNFGLCKRKAIYKNYGEALPDVPVVDAEALKADPEFIAKYASSLDLNQQDEVLSLIVGSVLVTTGFDSYKPIDGEFGYNIVPNVITLPEFNRLMELSPDKLLYNNKTISKIAFIYCVGNRQKKGDNKYCSRQCCTSAIYTSLQLNEKYENIKAFHLFRDIRTYGKQEILYEKSSKQGDIYIRFDEKEPPVVEQSGKVVLLKVKDYLTSKKELELEADLVVLVTGMVAREDSKQISEKFKIPIGSDRFFNEIHPKLKPVETVIKGVYIGGACQGPKNISESVQSSLSAAAKINALLKGGTVSLDPVVARVNNDLCTWCGKCADVCEYTAIREIEFGDKHIAAVNEAICTGCGICAPVCPVNAIEIAQFTDSEIESMIDGFMQKMEIGEKGSADEAVKETEVLMMKEFPQLWKNILAAIDGNKKSIPQLVEELQLSSELITYHVMTMNKYSLVMADGMDEKEAYYYYKRKN